jgi:hypothetical protein
MVIILRVEIDEETRQAVNITHGEKGLATRSRVAAILYNVIGAHLEDIHDDASKASEVFAKEGTGAK